MHALFPALLSLVAALALAAEYPTPNPTFDAQPYTTWAEEKVRDSRKAKVYVPFTAEDGSSDMISIFRLDLVGTDYERGYAHGYLLAHGKHSCEPFGHRDESEYHIPFVLLFIQRSSNFRAHSSTSTLFKRSWAST
jgi:hypothetical protein